jgi:hypothetical protein
MHRKSIKYRDTWAAPGSDLFAALEAGDAKKADAIYAACEARLKFEQGYRWEHSRGAVRNPAHVVNPVGI